MASWYYASEGKQEGPFSETQFRDFVNQGVIRADTLVWSEGMSGWQKASEIPGLLPLTGAPAVQPQSDPNRGAAADASPDTGNSRRATDIGGGEFRVGLVLSQTFSACKARLGTFLLMALLPGLVTIIMIVVGSGMTLGVVGLMAKPSPGAIGSIIVGLLIATLLLGVVYLGSQAMIAYGTFQILSGRNFSFGDALRHTTRRILSIVGAVVLIWLAAIIVVFLDGIVVGVVGAVIGQSGASVLGFLIIMIEMFFATTALFVTIPVCTVEPVGPLASLTRSVKLTKGHRWQIIGLLLIAGLGTFIAAIVVSAVAGGVALSALGDGLGGVFVAGLVNIVLQVVFLLFVTAFYSVLPAATYSNLRMAKEGIDVSDITNVFE